MAESPEQLHIKFLDAFNRHDLEGLVALYEPDAVLASSKEPMRGKDAIREAYRGYLANHPTMELQTLGANRVGELAMLHGHWVMSSTAEDGSPVRHEGHNTETVRLQPDGRWLFVIDNPSVS